MRLHQCTCGTQFIVNAPENALPFTYYGKAYAFHDENISRIDVTGFSGDPCPVCAGLVYQVLKNSGIHLQDDWMFLRNGENVYWSKILGSDLLSTYADNIMSATRKNRIPVPRSQGRKWYVTVGKSRALLQQLSCHGLLPRPEFFDPIPDFPLFWYGIGFDNTPDIIQRSEISRDMYEGFAIRGNKFCWSEFPHKYSRFLEIPAKTWDRLQELGYVYAICKEGVVYIPQRKLL